MVRASQYVPPRRQYVPPVRHWVPPVHQNVQPAPATRRPVHQRQCVPPAPATRKKQKTRSLAPPGTHEANSRRQRVDSPQVTNEESTHSFQYPKTSLDLIRLTPVKKFILYYGIKTYEFFQEHSSTIGEITESIILLGFGAALVIAIVAMGACAAVINTISFSINFIWNLCAFVFSIFAYMSYSAILTLSISPVATIFGTLFVAGMIYEIIINEQYFRGHINWPWPWPKQQSSELIVYAAE